MMDRVPEFSGSRVGYVRLTLATARNNGHAPGICAGRALAFQLIACAAVLGACRGTQAQDQVYNYQARASTPAQASMNGLSEVARASGQRNLDNSAAAINLTQARDNQLDNYNKQVNTYFQTRAAHDAYVAAERGPRLTPEQMARIAKVGAVKPLSTLQLDPVYGKISWTSLLNTDQFADERKDLNELFRLRSYHGHLSFEEQTAVRKSTDKLIGKLKVIVRDVPSSDYTASKNFVTSLASMARMPAS